MAFARTLAAAAALAFALPFAAAAHDGVQVHDAFALISPAGGSGAVFMRIDNAAAEDDRLVAARSDAAMRVELHTHAEDEAGVMRMIEVEEGFPIPAGGERLLQRGGDHVMLMGLTRELNDGDIIALTLEFEREGAVELEVAVGAPADAMHHGHDSHDHGHGHEHSHDH